MANPRETLRDVAEFPQDKGTWSRLTWTDAKAMEDALYARNPRFQPGDCKICNKPFVNLANHLASQKHFSKIWDYVQGQWPSEDEEPPYECWRFEDGSHHFLNHVTMEYNLWRTSRCYYRPILSYDE